MPASLGAGVGRLGYSVFKFRRDLVEQNLRTAFPFADDAWISRTAKAAYAHVAREALETIRLTRASKAQILARTTLLGEEHLAKPAVLVSGHIGNHEMAGAAMATRGFPLDIVAQRQGNPLFDAALIGARERLGIRVIDRAQATMHVVRSLRSGRLVGFAADQDAGRAGIFVSFFGRPASTHRGAALFAVRANVPLIMISSLRVGDRYEVRGEEIVVDRAGEVDDVVYQLVQAFTSRLEQVVRAAPEQYLWLHRRWKTRPPEELAAPSEV
jgi:KDO2-lipid IV(A) lauroyltransferase